MQPPPVFMHFPDSNQDTDLIPLWMSYMGEFEDNNSMKPFCNSEHPTAPLHLHTHSSPTLLPDQIFLAQL